MTYSDGRHMVRSDGRREMTEYEHHGSGKMLPSVATLIGLAALALLIMNAKDLYRYIKISSM